MNEIEISSCLRNVIIVTPLSKNKDNIGVPAVYLENLMMECIYVHIKSYMENVGVRKKYIYL